MTGTERPNVAGRVLEAAARTPTTPALSLNGQVTRYRELSREVNALAAALIAAGVDRGDRVATLATPHPDFAVAFLAAASIGAIWVGLNPRYRLEELRYVVADADPKILLTRTSIGGRDYAADITALANAAPSLTALVTLGEDPAVPGSTTLASFIKAGRPAYDQVGMRRAAAGGRDPCLIVYTSGSTGAPKGALLHHSGILALCDGQNALWPASAHRIVNYFPINHIGSLIDCTLPTLVAGGTVIFLEQFDPTACLELMTRERVTIWGSVPSVFQMQLALPDFARHDLTSVELVFWEGAAMPAEIIARLLTICPRLATNYGMTETSSAITVVEPTSDVEVLANSVGFPFPGVEVRVVDEAGRLAAPGDSGEIQTRSAMNFLGYWRKPEATAAAFTSDGWFRTGDLGVWRADRRLKVVGRMKEMYKSGGYNVYPREIECVLESHPAVALAAVVAAPDPLWQEVGVAYVAPRVPVTAADLEAHCRERLANYKVPKRIVIEPDLPLLPIGKVDKRALAERAQAVDQRRKSAGG